MISLDFRSRNWTKKSDSYSTQKPPTPCDSDTGSATLLACNKLFLLQCYFKELKIPSWPTLQQ